MQQQWLWNPEIMFLWSKILKSTPLSSPSTHPQQSIFDKMPTHCLSSHNTDVPLSVWLECQEPAPAPHSWHLQPGSYVLANLAEADKKIKYCVNTCLPFTGLWTKGEQIKGKKKKNTPPTSWNHLFESSDSADSRGQCTNKWIRVSVCVQKKLSSLSGVRKSTERRGEELLDIQRRLVGWLVGWMDGSVDILEELRELKTWVGDWMKMSDTKKKKRKACVGVIVLFVVFSGVSPWTFLYFLPIFSINHLTDREHQVS